MENEWHWARDAQLGEDAHRYANRTGVPVFALLRTIVMNLLRRGGYRSIRQGLRELAYDLQGMLALGGVATGASSTDRTFRQPWGLHSRRLVVACPPERPVRRFSCAKSIVLFSF